MKTIIRLLSLLSLTALTVAPLALATEPPPGPPAAGEHPRRDPAKMREHRMQELNEKLALTPDQQAQIKAIWDQAEAQAKALRAEAAELRAEGADLRARGWEVMKTTRAQVRGVLTPDQQKTFDAMPPPGRGHRGPPKNGGATPANSPPGKP